MMMQVGHGMNVPDPPLQQTLPPHWALTQRLLKMASRQLNLPGASDQQ
ncbi:MAG: hypothetical protein KDA85_18665 [Planctomycetaceae bacterium]|nr:hypothetical protein [Planctomycetaceae bacterium]